MIHPHHIVFQVQEMLESKNSLTEDEQSILDKCNEYITGVRESDEFEEQMQDIHAEDYTGLDDDMPDAFAEWFNEIPEEEMRDYLYHFILES